MASNQLENLIQKANLDPKQEREFHKLLLESEVYILGELLNEDEESAEDGMDEGADVSITHWQDTASGKEFIPVFTSMDRMTEIVDEDESYLCLNAADLLAMTEGEILYLNPDSEYGRVLSISEVQAILNPNA